MDERAADRSRAAMFVLVLILFKSTDATLTVFEDYSSASTANSQEPTDLRTFSTAGVSEGTASFGHESTPGVSDVHPSFSDRVTRTATDQSDQTFFNAATESWTSHSGLEISTELLNSSPKLTTNTATEWDDPSTVANITDAYLGSSSEQRPATDLRTARDLTVTDLTNLNFTDMDTTESVSHAGSTYMSTSNNRAGERTLLSITSNSRSQYTENSGTSGTSPDAFTERLRRVGVSTEDLPTNTTLEEESEVPSVSQVTQLQTGLPNVTGQSFDLMSETNESNSTPSVLDKGETETTVNSSTTDTSYTDSASTFSVPPFELTQNSSTDRAHQESEPTRASTESTSTFVNKQTDRPQTSVEETTVSATTTAPPTVWTDTTRVDESSTQFLSTLKPFIPQTSRPVEPTQVSSTTPGPVTQKPPLTEKYTTTPAATTTLASSSTSAAALLTTRQPQPTTTTTATAETQTSHEPSTAAETTQIITKTTTKQYHPSLRTTPPSMFTSSSQSGAVPTDVSTLHLETSTASPSSNTTHSRHTTASFTKSAPTMSTAVVTTEKHTETEATTEKIPAKSTQAPVHRCELKTCANGGTCVATSDGSRCECLSAWTGNTCTEDVDECVNSPCPPDSLCVNTRGSFSCECPLGYDLQDGRRCTQVKIFLGSFRINSSLHLRNNGLHELHKEIIHLLNASLSNLRGYRRSTLRDVDGLLISAVNMFSMSADVASTEICDSIQMSLRNCNTSHCTHRHQFTYQMESLCLAQNNRCDTQYSVCDDTHGTVYCRCHKGYFKKNPEDTTCRDCGDGFELVNGTCGKCAFGFGGFNCNNFYGLVAKVVSPAAGGLLLIVIVALIITCCRKDKNDINKIIFKSGELQMSPYPEFPKGSRVSMEWGRETIEMQENGSTKNLLQMTDIYYSPALRNADLERNGLYPFSGLPGSRHSCIYPAQWNPSFISDDSRRRDYF
ncbi:protein HEG [Trichomycterus rosablanca]|uniref:protein HEG n=1 Tax=Trichomycterus rosablanca TaxID=2290929 RepID=UPI002F352FFC